MRRLRIDLAAPPFAGHLHPILGIARRLAGDHDVRVLSTPGAQPRIAGAGVRGAAVLDGADAAILAIAEPGHAVRSHPLRLLGQLRANVALMARLREELLAIWSADRPDLLIADFCVPAAGLAAQARGIRWWTTLPSPCAIEAGSGPPGYLGGLTPMGGVAGRLRDAAGRALVRGFKRGVHALLRRELAALGLPSLHRADGTEAAYSPERILALGTRELEFPRAWPPALELVGPVLYTPPDAAPPPPFVPGRRHVLVTLGTHLHWRKDAVAAAVRAAARALPEVEFHFSDGVAGSPRREGEGNFHRLGWVPYERDLPRYALVVHHGGAGVLHECLRAGTPALVLPVDYDQFDHAARLEAAGVAWRVRRLADLPGLVARALDDGALAAACRHHRALLGRYRAEERIAGHAAALAAG